MTDIHTHILYDVDDGCRNIEESIFILKKLYKLGFNNVVLTPHYIKGEIYDVNNSHKLKKLNNLKNELRKQGIDINIYLGNEIFISNSLIEDIRVGNCYTLNNSNYILFEMPFHSKILNLDKWIDNMLSYGCKLILAHPERYTYFQKDYKLVDNLKKKGLLFQANYGSILNYYGKDSCNLLKYMLKNKYIDFFGTDIHRSNNTFVLDNFKNIEKEIINIVGKDYYFRIVDNGDRLIVKED